MTFTGAHNTGARIGALIGTPSFSRVKENDCECDCDSDCDSNASSSLRLVTVLPLVLPGGATSLGIGCDCDCGGMLDGSFGAMGAAGADCLGGGVAHPLHMTGDVSERHWYLRRGSLARVATPKRTAPPSSHCSACESKLGTCLLRKYPLAGLLRTAEHHALIHFQCELRQLADGALLLPLLLLC